MKTLNFTKYHTNVLRIYFCVTVTICHLSTVLYGYKIFHNYGVPAFFLISGYICYISLEKYSFLSFFKKRLSSLVIPYFISIIVYTILFTVYKQQFTDVMVELLHVKPDVITPEQNFINLITHFFFVHNLWGATSQSISPNLWFMGALIQLYLLSKMLFYFTKKYVLGISIIFAAYLITAVIIRKPDLDIGGGTNLSCIIPFILGMLFAKYNVQIFRLASSIFYKSPVAMHMYVILMVTFNFGISISSKQYISLNSIVIFISMPFFILLINYTKNLIKPNLVNKAVPITYFVYLYNIIFSISLMSILRFTNYNKFIGFLSSFLVILLFAYTFYKLDLFFKRASTRSRKIITNIYAFMANSRSS